MVSSDDRQASTGGADFARQAEGRSRGLVMEFLAFLRRDKKWWLVPVVALLLLFGTLIMIGGSTLAPFIYALF